MIEVRKNFRELLLKHIQVLKEEKGDVLKIKKLTDIVYHLDKDIKRVSEKDSEIKKIIKHLINEDSRRNSRAV